MAKNSRTLIHLGCCASMLVALSRPALAQPCQPAWSALGAGIDGQVFALGVWDPDGDGPADAVLLAGGNFTAAGGVPANNVAQWDGEAWSPLGDGVDDPNFGGVVWSFATFDEDDGGPNPPRLFVGGDFTLAGGVEAHNIARWDGSSWSAVGDGVRGPLPDVLALAVFDDDASGPNPPALFAGGEFDFAGEVVAHKVARWNGNSWSAVGTGVGDDFGFVSALHVHDEDGPGPTPPALFIGGEFSLIGGVSANNVARWNGSAFSALGTGTNGFVDDLAAFDEDADGPNPPRLFACGAFSRAGGTTVNGLGRWNGTSWSSVGGGFNSPAFALAVFDEDGLDPNPPALFAGGIFSSAGGTPATRIARWNGASWSALGNGVDGMLLDLVAFDRDGPGGAAGALVAGGVFDTAGAVPAARVASWVGCEPPAPCPGNFDGDGAVGLGDLALLLAAYGVSAGGDMDADGDTDLADLSLFLAAYGTSCP